MKLAKKLTKKQKKALKKIIAPVTCLFIIIFLLIGACGAYIYQMKVVKKVDGETRIALIGDTIVELNLGETYQEAGYEFVIDGVDYSEQVVIDKTQVNYDEKGVYAITYTLELNSEKIVLSRAISIVGGDLNG